MFSPFDLPPGILLLLSAQLSSPVDFILHRSFIDHLMGTKSTAESDSNSQDLKKPKVIVLSVSGDLTRWKSVAAKSNVHLDQQGSAFVFVHVLQHVPPPDNISRTEPVLRPILDAVLSALGPNEEVDTLVIMDDLAVLEWLGFGVLDVTRFVRALHATFFIFLKASATLLRQQVLTPPSTGPLLDDLFRHIRMCTYHVEVLPLASGLTIAVSGQVLALHMVLGGAVNKPFPRSVALQYRGCGVFRDGAGAF
ncbi:hypothetical protein DFH07DRAFT_883279 [Mycena maculata]|uniref:Uncharacterized protein n=1 Tax=Mycena maculata TaxID=230809 RepID=A0AAD7JEG4_9AGAR|nr:hypothetical protein DFH07DRAFT_883279 [Mycena maculata]